MTATRQSDAVLPRVPIVFAMDHAYVHPMSVALTSLAISGGVTSANAVIRVLHTDLTDEHQSTLSAVCSALDLDIEFVHVSPESDDFPLGMWFTPAVYTRLHLRDAAFDSSVALYLDCDLIAVGDLGELLATEPGPLIAAVRDLGNPVMDCGAAVPGYEELGIAAEREYFSAGVMLVNVEAWLAHDIAEQCRAFLTDKPEHVRLADQDALNVVVADRWRRLPLEWNVLPISAYIRGNEEAYRAGHVLPLEDAIALEDRARILHFAGPFKPWNPTFPPGPVLDRYRTYEATLREIQGRI